MTATFFAIHQGHQGSDPFPCFPIDLSIDLAIFLRQMQLQQPQSMGQAQNPMMQRMQSVGATAPSQPVQAMILGRLRKQNGT